ncbi:hypothetical protein JCM24511_04188 [Saitozyma sp. JCM 24511]|nr:hypothetical protein JCM24511_04188 [Saitozyma sp. JCM 24511]
MIRPATIRQPVSALRQLSTSAVRRDAVGTVGAPVVPKRPFLGFSAASGLAIYYLQQEAKLASSLLMQSVEELQQGTGKITSHLDRLQTVEKELAAIKSSAAPKDDVAKVRGEMKKVYDGLHLELLDLRAHVWGVEQDLQKVVKTDSIRI